MEIGCKPRSSNNFISLFAFDPIIEIDSAITDSIAIKSDNLTTASLGLDSIVKEGNWKTYIGIPDNCEVIEIPPKSSF